VRHYFFALTFVACLLFSAFGALQAQTRRPNGPPAGTIPSPSDVDDTQARLARDLAKKANLQRQASLKSDTDKLLKLATELKQYVDQSNENTLSLNVMKKAEEIEKLARSVKEKMKGPN